MKNLIFLILISLSIMSCNRQENNMPQPNNIGMRFTPTTNGEDFRAIGPCFLPSYPSWIDSDIVDIYNSNGQYYIDSLNYCIKQSLPITMLSNDSFTFNDYSTPFYHILNGSGYVVNDTLIITVNASQITGCTDQFTFHGKYYR